MVALEAPPQDLYVRDSAWHGLCSLPDRWPMANPEVTRARVLAELIKCLEGAAEAIADRARSVRRKGKSIDRDPRRHELEVLESCYRNVIKDLKRRR